LAGNVKEGAGRLDGEAPSAADAPRPSLGQQQTQTIRCPFPTPGISAPAEPGEKRMPVDAEEPHGLSRGRAQGDQGSELLGALLDADTPPPEQPGQASGGPGQAISGHHAAPAFHGKSMRLSEHPQEDVQPPCASGEVEPAALRDAGRGAVVRVQDAVGFYRVLLGPPLPEAEPRAPAKRCSDGGGATTSGGIDSGDVVRGECFQVWESQPIYLTGEPTWNLRQN
jgi:hypothetical protein